MLESRIFEIQQKRTIQHAKLEEAFGTNVGPIVNIEKYREDISNITKEMKFLAHEASETKKELQSIGKDELSDIITLIQQQEEELLVISAAYQIARNQQNEDEHDLRESRRSIRNRIAEVLEDYRAEMD